MAYTLIISIPKIFVNGQCSTSTYHQKRGHIILQCVGLYVAIVFANGILVENRCHAPIPVYVYALSAPSLLVFRRLLKCELFHRCY